MKFFNFFIGRFKSLVPAMQGTLFSKRVSVTFQNGIRKPYLVRGRFSTDDSDLQNAIESSAGFNKEYHLEHVDYPEGEAVQEIVNTTTDAVEEPVVDNEDLIPDEPENTDQEQVKDDEAPEVPEESKKNEEADEKKEPAGPVDYPEITNLQQAREKLFELFPGVFKPANLPNLKAVLNRAKEKNITFSKLIV